VPQTAGAHVGPAVPRKDLPNLSYQVLARKYRPDTFAEVVGQETVTRTLQNALRSGRVGHAFLLSGARGVGKTTTARILAKALNCSNAEGPTAEPCLKCSSCEEIRDGKSMDVQEIDGASNNSVDDVRELRESARYNPARDRFRIWIIDEVHMLSGPAFNALLKTLEEPPPRVKFIFATTEYHKLPDTILSRCQQYDFRMIPARDLVRHLRDVASKESIKVSEASLARIARAAEGSVRDALSLFDQVLAFSGAEVRDEDLQALLGIIDRELLLAASEGVLRADALALLELVERLSEYGADYRNFVRELLLHYRELLLVKLAPGESALLAGLVPEERERLRPAAEAYSEEDLLRAFEVLVKTEQDLRWAQDPRVTLEFALLKLAQLRRLVPFGELLARVESLEGGEPRPAAAPRPSSPRAESPALPPRRPLPPPPSARAREGGPPRGEGASPAPSAVAPPPAAAPMPEPLAAPPPPADSLASRPAEPTPSAPPVASQPPAAPPAGGGARRGDPPPAASAASLDPALVLEAMGRLAANRPSLAQALRSARARDEAGTLVLELAADFVALAELHADEYRDLAAQAAGRSLRLRFEAGAPAVTAPAAAAPATPAQNDRKQRLLSEASQDKAVQEALDLFNGKVVDVREA
jgi:DNA polymerase-3 subunit gamma/tau